MKWLRKLFPNIRGINVRIENEPMWNSSHADHLDAFLRTPTGRALIGRLQAQVLMTMLDSEALPSEQTFARQLASTIEVVRAHADVLYWSRVEKKSDLDDLDPAFRYFTEDIAE